MLMRETEKLFNMKARPRFQFKIKENRISVNTLTEHIRLNFCFKFGDNLKFNLVRIKKV